MSKSDSITFDQVRQSAAAAGLPIARAVAGSYEVPSSTEPGTVYTVVLAGAFAAVCSCRAGERGAACWHVARARELADAAPLPVLYCEAQDAYLEPDDATAEALAAAIRHAEHAAVAARGQAAADLLFGGVAA